ncbi:MAG: DUF5802 family protein [Haloarculaceae archaeon]
MFEPFSSSYYLGRLYVEPHDGDHAVMQRDEHERVNEQLYATGEGIERLDTPLVMKIGTRHFPVLGADGVPGGTVALPEDALDGAEVENPPSLREVLLATRERAVQLLQFAEAGGAI